MTSTPATPGALDLTPLYKLKTWVLGSPADTTSDTLLQMQLSAMSQNVLQHLERETFISTAYDDFYEGLGQRQQRLRRWPVTSVSLVAVRNVALPLIPYITPSGPSVAATETFQSLQGYGYKVKLWDGTLPGFGSSILFQAAPPTVGPKAVEVKYTAGYLQTDPAIAIPAAPYVVTTLQPFGSWIADNGVMNAATGAALTPITSGTPAAGQYLVRQATTDGIIPAGTYLFSQADQQAGVQVIISYSFCPAAVEMVLWDWVNWTQAARGRPGLKSKVLAGQETMVYDTSGVPDFVKSRLQPYANVVIPAEFY